MSIRIERTYIGGGHPGFRLYLSNDRQRIEARTAREVAQGVRHCFGEACGSSKTCPLCRAIHENFRKGMR